jgi:WD40 repeat protein
LELLEVEALLNRTTRLSYDHNHVHLPGHNGGPGVAFLDTDSGRLLSYDGEAVYSWNLEGNPEQETIFQLNHSGFDVIVGIDFSDDGRFAVLAYGPWASRAEANGKIALLEMENHTPPVTLYDKCDLYFFGWDNVVAISPDNRLVAASCRSERAIHLWDLATGEERLILWDQDIHSIHHLFFSTDNTLLATANRNDREGWVWNTETGAFWPQASLDLFYMGPVSYRAAEGWLTYGVDGAIRLLDLSAGKEISFQNVPEFKGLLPEPAISPDGQLLAAGFDDGIRLWDTQTRANVGFLNSVIVDSVAFSTDGRVLASGNLDGTITLWGVREEAP